MTPEEYKKTFGARVTPSYNVHTRWADRIDAAEATALVDFGCNIVDGKCRRSSKPTCCCENCGRGWGGSTEPRQFPSEEALAMAAELYVRPEGFWRLKGGCSLPRKYRTTMCLTFTCLPRNDPKMSGPEWDLIKYLRGMDESNDPHVVIARVKSVHASRQRRLEWFVKNPEEVTASIKRLLGYMKKLKKITPEDISGMKRAVETIAGEINNL